MEYFVEAPRTSGKGSTIASHCRTLTQKLLYISINEYRLCPFCSIQTETRFEFMDLMGMQMDESEKKIQLKGHYYCSISQ